MTPQNNFRIFLFITIIILESCNNSKHHEQNPAATYHFDLSKDFSREISIFDFCDSVKIVELESNEYSLLDERSVKGKAFSDTCFFLLTRDNQIFQYSYDGTLLAVINRYGRGSQEFSMAECIVFNKFTSTLDVVNPKGIIYKYTLKDFSLKEKLDFSNQLQVIHDIFPISQEEYLCYTDNDDNTEVKLLNSNIESETIFVTNTPTWLYGTAFSGGGRHFYDCADNFYYLQKYDGTVYHYDISSKTFTISYSWDMCRNSFSPDLIKSGKDFFYYLKLFKSSRHKYACNFIRTSESDCFFFTNFSFNNQASWNTILYTKNTNTVSAFKQTKEDVHFFVGPIVNNTMYYLADSDVIDLILTKNILSDRESVSLLQNIDDNTNLVLVKYYLRGI